MTDHQPDESQRKLLAWILLAVFVLLMVLLLIVILDPNQNPLNNQYGIFVAGLAIFLIVPYVLNSIGFYNVSAATLVLGLATAPWVSMLFDPGILQGDFVPLAYIVLPILLSSILCRVQITVILAILQFAGATFVLMYSPSKFPFNWLSFLFFVFATSALSIFANSMIQRNLKQIAYQVKLLADNEVILREQAIRDPLTNLFNRRYLQESLEREIDRATRARHPLGIIMLDVNGFKQINDTLGHAAGDVVLQDLGKFLLTQVRQYDIVCRYGGDEFVIIMPDTSQESTKERAGHLQAEIKNLDINQGKKFTITISVGTAVFPADGSTVDEILISADKALYRKKGNK